MRESTKGFSKSLEHECDLTLGFVSKHINLHTSFHFLENQ